MKENIVGREAEKAVFDEIYHSGKSEFVAVCGRRRVGKTFLIKEYFEGRLVFQTAGLASGGLSMQIKAFHQELLASGLNPQAPAPADWMDVFFLLRQYLDGLKVERKVVLLDELPWMDTPRSGFIPALEHFWNSWASGRRDVVLIVCGSATSWMMDKLINNHGGLYNRLTRRIFLQPFTLRETEDFLTRKGFLLSRYEVALCYMTLGGIPFYLDLLSPALSLAQNVDHLLFSPQGTLHGEFRNLYAALFRNSDDYVAIVKALSQKRTGLTRSEVIAATGIGSGNTLTTALRNLESCGFVRTYRNYQAGRSEATLYQLVDFYTLFYFHFLATGTTRSWLAVQGKAEFFAWAGLTFEMLVLCHIDQIKRRLGISGIETEQYAWRSTGGDDAMQVDLVIQRADRTINLCEVKFSMGAFAIDAAYAERLRTRVARFMDLTRHRHSILLTFITTYGVEKNRHSGVVQSEVCLDDLFAG